MSSLLPVSVILLCFNDELLIRAALQSVVGWASEVHIVDSGSTDRTLEIAKEYTQKISIHPFENYAAQRNWAQDNLSLANEWVLHLDSDERVTTELRESLEAIFSSGRYKDVDGFLVARRTVFMGRWIRYGGHYPVYHLRIFRHKQGRCEDRLYDQHFVVNGQLQKISGDITDTITADVQTWILRHVRWAQLEVEQQSIDAKDSADQVKEALSGTPIQQRRWLKNSVYNRSPLFFRAFVYFIYRYFLRLGFLDGIQGLIFHVLQGFWFRFYIDAKLWEARNRSGK